MQMDFESGHLKSYNACGLLPGKFNNINIKFLLSQISNYTSEGDIVQRINQVLAFFSV